jgi:hypothetical protein
MHEQRKEQKKQKHQLANMAHNSVLHTRAGSGPSGLEIQYAKAEMIVNNFGLSTAKRNGMHDAFARRISG